MQVAAHRLMRDPLFRQQQVDGLRAPHVAAVNALVDELNDPYGQGQVPYVAPVYGGVDAQVLCIQRDPGPMTNSDYGGSGFLCPENDDATAERFATLLDEAGIAVSAILAWNAYPWYINRMPRAAELEAGVEPLRRPRCQSRARLSAGCGHLRGPWCVSSSPRNSIRVPWRLTGCPASSSSSAPRPQVAR